MLYGLYNVDVSENPLNQIMFIMSLQDGEISYWSVMTISQDLIIICADIGVQNS